MACDIRAKIRIYGARRPSGARAPRLRARAHHAELHAFAENLQQTSLQVPPGRTRANRRGRVTPIVKECVVEGNRWYLTIASAGMDSRQPNLALPAVQADRGRRLDGAP